MSKAHMTFAHKTDKQVGKCQQTENSDCHLPTEKLKLNIVKNMIILF